MLLMSKNDCYGFIIKQNANFMCILRGNCGDFIKIFSMDSCVCFYSVASCVLSKQGRKLPYYCYSFMNLLLSTIKLGT